MRFARRWTGGLQFTTATVCFLENVSRWLQKWRLDHANRSKHIPRRSLIPRKLRIWRLGKTGTRIFGPEYRRSRVNVEIDITYLCNLQCHNCNRSLGEEQLPSEDRMSIAQVHRFLEESVRSRARFERIRIVGGEPTLHPDFKDIAGLIIAYRDRFWPKANIEVSTNGHGKKVNLVLDTLPKGINAVLNTSKTSNEQPGHVSFNVAPVDTREFQNAEYGNGCWIAQECGMGVTPYGYYPCAVAGSIDRIFGLNLGRKRFPDEDDDMLDELRAFCSLCGHFKRKLDGVPGPKMSPSWEDAYRRATVDPKTLTRMAGNEAQTESATTRD